MIDILGRNILVGDTVAWARKRGYSIQLVTGTVTRFAAKSVMVNGPGVYEGEPRKDFAVKAHKLVRVS